MTQDDQQPEQAPGGGGISRDTLLLLGALTFLILAVALTFFFTPGSGISEDDLEATAIAQATALATVEPYPGAAAPTTELPAGPYPEPGLPTAAPDSPYPIGSEGPLGQATDPTPAGLPGMIPTGDPSLEPMPTEEDAAGGQIATPPLDPTEDEAYPGPYPGPVGEGTPPPLPTLNPTVIVPTAEPPPTRSIPTPAPASTLPSGGAPPEQPAPTAAPAPTEEFDLEATSPPVAPPPAATPPPSPTVGPPPPPPADVLRGNVRWAAGQSPIILRRDVQLAPGAELVIEPGVEVRLDPGVSIYVDGARLLAMGLPGQPVRFVGATGARWSGIFGRPGSFIVLENSEIRGGGAGGTVMAVDESELIIRSSRFNDNGGALIVTDTKLEMRESEVAGNDVPFGPALEASYARGNFVTLRGNRFGGNRLGEGAPQVRLINSSTYETLNIEVEGNLLRGGTPTLQLSTDGPLQGTVLCNSMVGGGHGFGLRTQTPQVAPNGLPPQALRIENNFIDEHLPPIIPVYLRYGLGRGATSEVLLDMRNNWWGDPSGPYEPDTNPLGRGDSVGNNIIFAPWLEAPPACAPPH